MIANYADHSANERTFLAWVRTAISVVGFGLAVERLGTTASGPVTGIALMGSGAAVIVIAYWRMRRVRKRIADGAVMDDDSTLADGALVALIVALFGMLASFALHVTPA